MNIVTLLPQTHCSLTYPPPHTFPVLLPLLGVSWSKVIFTYSKRLLTKAGFVAVGLMTAHPSPLPPPSSLRLGNIRPTVT